MNATCRLGVVAQSVFVIAALLLASLTGSLSAQSGCTPPPSGLVGWWKGDSNAIDTIGGNNGTMQNGASFAAGEVNQAFAFNGTNQFVAIPDAPALDPTNSLTVEAWVYVSGPPSVDVATIVTKQGTIIASDIQYQLESYNSPGGLSFRCTVYLPTGYAVVNGTNQVQLNTWYHIAMTYDNASLKLYVNGALNGSVAASGPIAPTTEPLRIGGAGSGPWFFNGRVDEVSLYDRALSLAELQAVYNAGAAGKCVPLIAPFFETQPQSQSVSVGTNVTFVAEALGTLPLSYQWEKNGTNLSGATPSTLTITNVQVADAGVYSVVVSNVAGTATSSNATLSVTVPPPCQAPAPGLIAWWRAEGDASDSSGANHDGTLKNAVTFTQGKVGQAFSFDGISSYVEVPDDPALRLTSEITIELWVKRLRVDGHSEYLIEKGGDWTRGQQNYALQIHTQDNGLCLTWDGGYRIAGVITNLDWHHCAVVATNGQTDPVLYIDGAPQAITQSTGGKINLYPSTLPLHIGAQVDQANGLNYYGNTVIDELSVYDRALSPNEIMSIYTAGAAGKCVGPIAPSLESQPQNQSALVGQSVIFAVLAAGSQPLSYQWQFNGTAISGATTNSLTLSSVSLGSAGSYSVVVTNVVGSITSSPAMLTVALPPASVQVGTATVASDGTVTAPVNLVANGNENAVSFTLDFDPTILTNIGVGLGSGAAGANLLVNQAQSAAGKVGVAIALPANSAFPAGTQQLVVVTFASPVITSATSTPIGFGATPVTNLLADVGGHPLAATFVSGAVLLPATQLEGDVYPRPNGDQALTVSDWVLVGRYVAGLDSPTNALEFEKADCAPRASLGDGKLTVSDWVQAGRYAAGLDPLTRAGGPTSPVPNVVVATVGAPIARRTQSDVRQVSVAAPSLAQGQTGTIEVNLEAQGNENALAFSLSFDPAQLVFVAATAGSAADGAVLNVNANQAAQGRIGCVLALRANQSFAMGSKPVVNVMFRATTSAGGAVPVSFGDQPVIREVSDPNASTLATDYINGTVVIAPLPSLSITTSSKNISLSWPASASGFVLQESSDANLGAANWTAVTATPAVVNSRSVVSLPLAPGKKFYRLYHP